MQILLGYLLAVNAVTLCASIIDKGLAIQKRRRVPEGVLLTLSFVGGAVGALMAQVLTGHKRLKADYCASLTLIVLLQAGGVAALWSENLRADSRALYERIALNFGAVEDEPVEAEDVTHVSREVSLPRRFGPGS